MTLPVPPHLKPMEAEPVDDLPTGAGWLYEPKYDGFRCLAFRDGDRVDLQSKKQKSLNRFFPEARPVPGSCSSGCRRLGSLCHTRWQLLVGLFVEPKADKPPCRDAFVRWRRMVHAKLGSQCDGALFIKGARKWNGQLWR